jgi:hypothetical protein
LSAALAGKIVHPLRHSNQLSKRGIAAPWRMEGPKNKGCGSIPRPDRQQADDVRSVSEAAYRTHVGQASARPRQQFAADVTPSDSTCVRTALT